MPLSSAQSTRRVPRYPEADEVDGLVSSDPRNEMLDQFEAQLRLLLDQGLEVQLRARCDRVMAQGPAVDVVPSDPKPLRLDPMALAGVLVVCRQLERFKLTADQHAAIARLKDWLMSQMPALKGAA
jgi:hypothetical protein